MPFVLVGALVAGIGGALAGALGVTAFSILGLSATLSGFLVSFATSLILGALSALLSPKPSTGTTPPSNATTSVREPIGAHKIVIGQMRTGGELTFVDVATAAGLTTNQLLYICITFSALPVESVTALYANQLLIGYNVSGGLFSPPPFTNNPNYATVNVNPPIVNGVRTLTAWLSDGTVPGDVAAITPFTDATLGTSRWTGSMFQYTRAKLFLRLIWNQQIFGPTGIPNITAVARGKEIYDPRNATVAITSSASGTPGVFTTATGHGLNPGDRAWILNHAGSVPAVKQEFEVGTTPSGSTFTLLGGDSQPLQIITGGTGGIVAKMTWTDNVALAVAWYLCDQIYGLACDYVTEIDEAALIQAANDCDGMVTRAALQSFTFTADPTTNFLTTTTESDLPTGTQVMVSNSGGALPSPLAANTIYYVISVSIFEVALATTADNAITDRPSGVTSVAIDITDAGSGTQTLQVVCAFTADPTTDVLTLGTRTTGTNNVAQNLQIGNAAPRILTGTRVTVSSTGTLPAGLSAATNYFGILLTDFLIRLATSLGNARLGVYINLGDAGTGIHSINVNAEPRYTANGIIDTSVDRQSIIQGLLSAMGGYAVCSGGVWGIYAAVWRSASVGFDEDDLRGPIEVQTLISGQEAFNQVKGTFQDPFSLWQTTDLPQIENSTYVADDNGEIVWKDVAFAYTISAVMGQRLMKIELERMRQELTVTLQLNLAGMQVKPPDNIELSNTRWGWSDKIFELQSWALRFDDDNGVPRPGVDMMGRETASGVFDWDSGSETRVDLAPNTGLPDPFKVAAPQGLTLASGTDELDIRLDGTVFSRILVSWTQSSNQFVIDGGSVEVQYKKSAVSVWNKAAPVPGDQTFTYILDVQDGALYDVRARFINSIGVASDKTDPWQSTITSYMVIGKEQPPSDVPSLTVVQNGTSVVMAGGAIADLDVGSFEFRYGGGSALWETATFIEAPHAQPTLGGFSASCTTAAIGAGTWKFFVKARDTSGNYSVNATAKTVTVTSDGATPVASEVESPDWPGLHPNVSPPSSSGFLLHYMGYLVPDSIKLATQHTDQELFEKFVPFPVSQAIYEARLMDFGFTDTARFAASPFDVLNGRGVAGSVACKLQVDFWKDGDSDTGVFNDWNGGTLTARYVRPRILMTPGTVPGYVQDLSLVADKQSTTQTVAGLTIAPGGTAITFATPFHSTPLITCVPTGANIGWVTSPTNTGCTLHMGPDTSHDNGGTGGYIATGA